MKMKLLGILLAVMALGPIGLIAQDETPAPAQEQPAPEPVADNPAIVQPVPVAPADMPKGAKPVKPETRTSIRDLQVQQDHVLIAIKQNELDHDALVKRSAEFDAAIKAKLQEDAKRQKIDTEKHTFNLDTMMWIPKGEK